MPPTETVAALPAAPVETLAIDKLFDGPALPVPPVSPVGPAGPVGNPKFKIGFVLFPVIVAVAVLPAGRVVASTEISGIPPAAPVSPFGITRLNTWSGATPSMVADALVPAAPVAIVPSDSRVEIFADNAAMEIISMLP